MGGVYTWDGLRCCDICNRSRRDGEGRTVRSDVWRPGYSAVLALGSGEILYYVRYVRFEVRTARCPAGYCKPVAACTDCRLAGRHLHTKSQREHCRRQHEEFEAELREEAKRKREVLA